MPRFYKPGLTEVELLCIERMLEKSLPADYRHFLTEMNGFYLTSPDDVDIPLSAVDEGQISVDRLFGFLPSDPVNDVVDFNKEFIEELDFLDDAIAIGEDGGGNPYVIVSGAGAGVYYWDRTHLHEGDSKKQFDIAEVNGCGNLYFVAADFCKFYSLIMKRLGGSHERVQAL